MATDPLPDDAPDFPRPRPAKAALKPGTALPDYLPARMLNEFVYCPRLFYYEWVDGVFAHSSDTLEGAFRHEKVDARSDPLPEDPTGAESIHSRSVELASERLHIIAKIDLVEGEQ